MHCVILLMLYIQEGGKFLVTKETTRFLCNFEIVYHTYCIVRNGTWKNRLIMGGKEKSGKENQIKHHCTWSFCRATVKIEYNDKRHSQG